MSADEFCAPQGWAPTRFAALYAHSPDPWAMEGSWYEERKRALLLASLPEARYRHAFEPGCGAGLLTAALAPRCDRLLASDCAAQALVAARQRLADQPHVAFAQLALPGPWPREAFDLVVLSELLYYLAPEALEEILAGMQQSLPARTTLVACHFRHAIAGCALSGAAVHARLHEALGWPRAVSVRDADFVLDVWARGSDGTLAQREKRL
ncbi:SAM-dependent methyltransferase [Melaminivora sp.]|uniref:SAM-dependent methyltransferase n=1 Tax=Melaminivora sp. TaxID=1933032 RepID=UPI0028A8C017|nr:SAM-dependent methyltransferase [Melaminivora sp.]